MRGKKGMKKKLYLKQSVKDYLMIILLIGLVILGLFMMRFRSKQIDSQLKMTEISGTYISQNN